MKPGDRVCVPMTGTAGTVLEINGERAKVRWDTGSIGDPKLFVLTLGELPSADERAQAAAIANRLLDEPNADPDDDIRVLARQFERSQEQIQRLKRERDECGSGRLARGFRAEFAMKRIIGTPNTPIANSILEYVDEVARSNFIADQGDPHRAMDMVLEARRRVYDAMGISRETYALQFDSDPRKP